MKSLKHRFWLPRPFVLSSALLVSALTLSAASVTTILEENFDSYNVTVATNLDDQANANFENGVVTWTDDQMLTSGTAGAGVQLVNWLSHSGSQSLLLRAGTEIQYNLTNAVSGTQYQFDFWLYVVKGTGDRNFYIILRGEGSDVNANDYIAYQSHRAADNKIFYYDGILPGTAAFTDTGASHIEGTWQHHRLVVDTAAQKMTMYLDDMTTPVLTDADLARSEIPVPTQLRIVNEGNSEDDGYFLIDDISLTATGAISLETPFTDSFETYPARVNADDDADPQGPWITVETAGTSTAAILPTKVQVVDSSVVPAHTGTNCLKIEGSQRAGSSIAWGVPPQQDVQITWWARVPASVAGKQANYLRFSLYGTENGSTYAGDCALLGYGSRNATIGDETSLTYYTNSPGWLDTTVDYTPDTWEEYRLETQAAQNTYSMFKNPSSANPITIVDQVSFIGTVTNTGPIFMAAWSSSNMETGASHPPVYIDDITIKAITSVVPFKVTSFARSAAGVELKWQPAGSVTYRVERSTTLAEGSFETIATSLTGTDYTDATAPEGTVFYRVVAQR
jgi:hypothetical protein